MTYYITSLLLALLRSIPSQTTLRGMFWTLAVVKATGLLKPPLSGKARVPMSLPSILLI